MNTRVRVPGRGWAYTGAILGGLVSIAANVAHSFIPPHGSPTDWAPEPGAVVGAVVWPVFLFVAVEIFVRVRWPHGVSWHLLRWVGLLPVAAVAAFVSYRHLSGLLAHYGEEPIIYYVGPLAVDGLMVMATGALMATSRHRTHPPAPAPSAPSLSAPTAAPAPPGRPGGPDRVAVAHGGGGRASVPGRGCSDPGRGGASDHPTPPDPHPGGSGRRAQLRYPHHPHPSEQGHEPGFPAGTVHHRHFCHRVGRCPPGPAGSACPAHPGPSGGHRVPGRARHADHRRAAGRAAQGDLRERRPSPGRAQPRHRPTRPLRREPSTESL